MSKITPRPLAAGEASFKVASTSYIAGHGDERKVHPRGAIVTVNAKAAEKFVRAGVLVAVAPAARPAKADADAKTKGDADAKAAADAKAKADADAKAAADAKAKAEAEAEAKAKAASPADAPKA